MAAVLELVVLELGVAAVAQILSQHLCVCVLVRCHLWHSAVQLQTAHLLAVPELGAHLRALLDTRPDVPAGVLVVLLHLLGVLPPALPVSQAAHGHATHGDTDPVA